MSIEGSDMAMYHCPNCDVICAVSESDISKAHADGKIVEISCHKCEHIFPIVGDHKTNDKIGRPAKNSEIFENAIESNSTLPTAPKADKNLGQTLDDLTNQEQLAPRRKPTVSYVPLYFLFLICLGAFLFWMHDTGQIKMEQWVTFLE